MIPLKVHALFNNPPGDRANRAYLDDVTAHEHADICLWVFVVIFDCDEKRCGLPCLCVNEREEETQMGRLADFILIKCDCLAAPDQWRWSTDGGKDNDL